MKKFTDFMEEKFVPIAAKIGSQKHLVAIRDSFIATMPITMAGSIAVLLNALVRDIPGEYGWDAISSAFAWLIGINGFVWWGTLAVLSAVLAFAVGYNFAQAYDVNPVAGGLVSFSAFIITLPQGVTAAGEVADAIVDGVAVAEGVVVEGSIGTWGNISVNYLNTGGLFTALLVGMIATVIYAKLMNANIIIKLPDEVPPAVSRAFAAIIPGLAALYVVGAAAWLTAEFTTFGTIPDLISNYLQKPFMALSQNVGSIVVITFFVSLFWFFGLHGPNVLAPALDGIYGPALNENVDHYQLTASKSDLPHIWTRGSFDAFSWMGGSGSTLALIIAILVLSKRADQRAVAKYALPMGLFNINEPVLFGLPIVLNPVYLIPFLIVPVIQVVIAFYATKAGIVPPVHINVPWVLPPVIYAFMATGFSVTGALLALFNIGVAVVIWGAFVLVANTMDPEEA